MDIIMKKITIYTILTSLIGLFFSCDQLERPDASGLTKDVVFSNMREAERTLATSYAFAPWGYPVDQGDGSWAYAFRLLNHNTSNISDEAHTQSNGWDIRGVENYIYGRLTSSEIYPFQEDKWMFNYQAIRNAWLFIENVDNVTDGNPAIIKIRKAEAKAFIATKQYENLKRYGGLAWVPEYPKLGVDYPTERLSISQSVDAIVALLDEAIPDLPMKTENEDFGRINKVAAMVLKARTLLWSASPLFNPENNQSYFPGYGNQQYLKHDNYDKERWRLAAEASDLALQTALSNGYKLIEVGDDGLTSYKQAYKAAVYNFPNDPIKNREIIWGTRLEMNYNAFNWGQWFRIPWGAPGSGILATTYNTCIPLHNFVELYEMKNGSDQPVNLFSTPNPYNNLDSRFSASMTYHGYRFEGASGIVIDMSFRSNEDKGVNHPPASDNTTGYYCNKFIKDQEATGELAFHNVFWPYIRLAEVYLMAAEAWNEYDSGGKRQHILSMINAVRERSGQPKLETIPSFQNTQEYIRERIKRERAIELAFEEHRYFDLKRWKDGDKLRGQMYSMEIRGNASTPTYTKKVFKNPRIFSDRDYLYPIPLDEIRKSDMKQNPGW